MLEVQENAAPITSELAARSRIRSVVAVAPAPAAAAAVAAAAVGVRDHDARRVAQVAARDVGDREVEDGMLGDHFPAGENPSAAPAGGDGRWGSYYL